MFVCLLFSFFQTNCICLHQLSKTSVLLSWLKSTNEGGYYRLYKQSLHDQFILEYGQILIDRYVKREICCDAQSAHVLDNLIHWYTHVRNICYTMSCFTVFSIFSVTLTQFGHKTCIDLNSCKFFTRHCQPRIAVSDTYYSIVPVSLQSMITLYCLCIVSVLSMIRR